MSEVQKPTVDNAEFVAPKTGGSKEQEVSPERLERAYSIIQNTYERMAAYRLQNDIPLRQEAVGDDELRYVLNGFDDARGREESRFQPDNLRQELSNNDHARLFFSATRTGEIPMAGKPLLEGTPRQTTCREVTRFFASHRTAIEFDEEARRFIERYIDVQVGPLGADKARADLRLEFAKIGRTMYGDQWDAYTTVSAFSRGKYNSEVFDNAVEQKQQVLEKVRRFQDEMKSLTVEEMGDEEGEALLATAEIHGDEFNGEKLTVEYLKEQGLVPKHKLETSEGVMYVSSNTYEIGGDRIAATIYVKDKDGKLVARSVYKSNSHAVWRYLPSYTPKKGKISWYDKGHSEESVTMPAVAQVALNRIQRENETLIVENPELIFAGTARDNVKNLYAYQERTFNDDVRKTAIRLNGNFYQSLSERIDKKIPPEELVFDDPGQEPEFEDLVATWKDENKMYGEVTYEAFISKNGDFRYLMCRDGQGRSWVGGIEVDAPIAAVGLKERWVFADHLTTPAVEHRSQTYKYGGKAEDDRGKYIDMYKNYVSKIPLVKWYEESVRRRGE